MGLGEEYVQICGDIAVIERGVVWALKAWFGALDCGLGVMVEIDTSR